MFERRLALPQLLVTCLFPVLLGLILPSRAAAQVMQPMCVEGCLPDYAVTVTPDGTDAPDRSATTGGYYATFSIHNSGQLNDTYLLSCSVTGPVTCDSLSTSSITVNSGSTKTAKAWYSVGNPGTGTIKLQANGEASDLGYFDVHVVTPPGSPIVLLKPWNGAVRDLSACVNACFEKVVTHATPAYITMDVPRSFGLTYASGSARPTPVVWVDVLRPSGATSLNISLQRVSNGARLTLLNGADTAWYAVSGDTVRMAAAFDAVANSITASGVYDIRVTVTASFASGSPTSTTLTTTVPIVVTRGGAFGDGVWPTGLARLVTTTDAGGSALLQSDGSIFYYGAGHPGGITASLSGNTLTALDGSTVTFNGSGLPTAASDRYGNTTHYYWTTAQLDSLKDPMGKKIALTYSGGKLATATDPGGRVTHYTINGSNQLVAIQDPDTVSTQFGYDALGLLTTLTGRNGAVWTTVYDELHRVKADSAPAVLLHDGTTRRPTVTYLAAERVVWQPGTAGTSAATAKAAVKIDTIRADITDPLGARSRFKMDRFGSPLLAINPLGATTTFTRDTSGRVTQTIEPNGHMSQAMYGYENPILQIPYNPYLVREWRDASKGLSIIYHYNAQHDVTSFSGTNNWIVQRVFTYDTFNRLSTVKIGGNTIASATYAYDSLSRPISVKDAEGHKQTSTYDATTGNLATSTDALRHPTTRYFDALGRTDSVRAPNGAVNHTTYGTLNQVLSTTNPLGYTTQTRYNADLTVQRIIDARNQVYKFSYNVLGWPTARFDLADTTKADSMWYDAAGQVKRTRTRRGNVLQALYDITGRLTELMYRRPGATVDTAYAIFKYDTLGKRMTGWNWTQTDSLVYNGLGQLTGHWMRQGSETFRWDYQYDDQDRLTARYLYQNGTSQSAGYLSRGFDTYGQLTSTSAAGVSVRFDRTTADSLPTKRVINPGSAGSWWMSSVLDSVHMPTRDSLSIAVLDDKYGKIIQHDSLGRLTSTDPYNYLGGRRYRYDAAGQLRQACTQFVIYCIGANGTQTLTEDAYTYDATGNRTDTAATTTTVIGAGNRVTQFKGYTLTYDADGNIISKVGNGESWTYTWDPFDKLTDVKLNGTLVYHFIYDAFGHRVNRCTNAGCSAGEREINDGSQFVLARNGSNVVTDAYGYYPGGDQPMSIQLPSGRTGVFITDPQLRGTVRAIADADKNATNVEFKSYDISPWGEVAADTGSITRLRMAGQQYDQGSELYYMRARYYDPQLGRFLSEDPIGISGGLNLYAYAGNDPVNMWDPTGMDPMAGGEGCDLPGGGRGVRNKQGECVAVTLPDITVSSQAEPPTDIVTIEPGRQYFINVYEGAVYPAKTGRKPWQEPQSLGPPVLARHGTPDSVVTACVMLRKQVKKGVGRAIVGLPLLPMEMVFGSGFGRLPHHVGSVNDVIPGGVWTPLQEGTAEALPPFAEYQALDCQHNVLQSD